MVRIGDAIVREHRRPQVDGTHLAVSVVQANLEGVDVECGCDFQYCRLVEFVHRQRRVEEGQEICFQHTVERRIDLLLQVVAQLGEFLKTCEQNRSDGSLAGGNTDAASYFFGSDLPSSRQRSGTITQ